MSRPGIPLLSGRPPHRPGPSQNACRKCGKEFSILFNRRRECLHCGYDYCSSCTDYQALVPRRGPAQGYDVAHVCAFCIEMLNVTALGKAQLRSLPLAKLRRYMDAYNIPTKNAIDKNDLVDAALAARTPRGCLSPVNEDYYRKHSVPSYSQPGSSPPSSANRNSSARGFPNTNANSSPRPFARPDLDPNHRQYPQETAYRPYAPRRVPNGQRSRTSSAPTHPGTARPGGQPDVSRPTSSAGRQSTPYATSTPHVPPHPVNSPPLPPPMSTLVTFSRSALSALSVGTLKQILWEARVRVPPGVVEKEELVERVWALVEEEKRKDDEGMENFGFDMDEEDMEEAVNLEAPTHPEVGHEEVVQGDSEMTYEHLSVPPMDSDLPSSRPTTPQLSTFPPGAPASPSPASKAKARFQAKVATAERSGLCVVCQDEEACIAIVDCGHLALCRECSDLVLASSKECPLCRTRIVTEGRLLRIFKT